MTENEIKEYLHKLGVDFMKFNTNGKDGAVGFVAEFSTKGNVKMNIIRGLLDTADLVNSIINKAYKLAAEQSR